MTHNSENQATIESGTFKIHYLIENSIIYMCICDTSYSRKLAFSYLGDILKEFYNSYRSDVLNSAIRPYSFISFDNFLNKTKKVYQDQRAQYNLDKLNNDLTDVKKIMTKNIEDLLYRGESLDKMTDLLHNLKNDSLKYRKSTRKMNIEALIRQYLPIIIVCCFFICLVWFVFYR